MRIKVLSGGQTGVGQAALRASRSSGLETGGWSPLGWETEDGPAPWLADYGLLECPESGYPASQERNVADADTMILIGDKKTPGSIHIMKNWDRTRRLASWVWVEPGVSTPRSIAGFLQSVRRDGKPVRTVLVAGNRESQAPGIGERTEKFLLAVLKKLVEG